MPFPNVPGTPGDFGIPGSNSRTPANYGSSTSTRTPGPFGTSQSTSNATPKPGTSFSTRTTSSSLRYPGETTSTSQAYSRSNSRATSRPPTRTRSRAASSVGGSAQQIVCAVSESRGVSPTVGLAFVNVSTGEAVLSQICDNQFYVRTILKLQVFEPTEILLVNTSGPPNIKSKMYSLIEEGVIGSRIVSADRRYWSESAGMDYIQQLAFPQDVEAIKVVIGGNFYATCCLAAVRFSSPCVPDRVYLCNMVSNIS